MENLFPEDVIDITDDEILSTGNEDIEPNFKPGLLIDEQTNDFALSSSGNILESDETIAWMQWCKKNLETPREQCLAYSDAYGIDVESVMKCVTREEKENMLYAEISEALLSDPYNRTAYVYSVTCEWESDSVLATVTVVGNDGSKVDITAEIQAG